DRHRRAHQSFTSGLTKALRSSVTIARTAVIMSAGFLVSGRPTATVIGYSLGSPLCGSTKSQSGIQETRLILAYAPASSNCHAFGTPERQSKGLDCTFTHYRFMATLMIMGTRCGARAAVAVISEQHPIAILARPDELSNFQASKRLRGLTDGAVDVARF